MPFSESGSERYENVPRTEEERRSEKLRKKLPKRENRSDFEEVRDEENKFFIDEIAGITGEVPPGMSPAQVVEAMQLEGPKKESLSPHESMSPLRKVFSNDLLKSE